MAALIDSITLNLKYFVECFIRVFHFIAISLKYNSIFYSHLRDSSTEIMQSIGCVTLSITWLCVTRS